MLGQRASRVSHGQASLKSGTPGALASGRGIRYTEGMPKPTIYHNPRCSKSRQALALLEQAGTTPEVVKYLETPPTPAELDALLRKLGLDPRALLRTGEDRYAELGLADRELDREALIRIMADNPILIERPIVVVGDRAVVARPPERATELLG